MSLNTILATAPLTATGYHLKATGTTLGQSLIWDNGTNVGIGNTNTSYTLDVSGTLRNTTSAYFATTSGSVGIGSTTANAKLDVASTYVSDTTAQQMFRDNTGGGLLFGGTGGAVKWLQSQDYTGAATYYGLLLNPRGGFVGVNGSTTPAAPLTVYDLTSGSEQLRLCNSNGGGYWGIGRENNITGDLYFKNGSSTKVVFTANGYVSIGKTTSQSKALELYQSTDAALRIQNSTTGTGNTDGLLLEMGGSNAILYNYESGYLAFGTSATERMRIRSDGNIGINDSGSSLVKLAVQGQSTSSSDYVSAWYNSAGTTLFYVRNDGYGFINAAAWAYGSDLRIKENISDVENGLDMVLKMKPKHFDYIDGQKDNLGFIAQDIEEIIPQAVNISDESTGMLALKTDFLIPYLVKAIQEMNTKLDEQNQTIQNLQEQINILAK